MNSEYISKVVDLTDPTKNVIYNMSHQEAVDVVKSGDLEAVRKIDGQFCLISVEGKTIKMARSIGRPIRYFIAKQAVGPQLIVAERIDVIYEHLKKEGLDDQFHPSYTRMAPAHYVTRIELLGCPDPNPIYERFFTPIRNSYQPNDIEQIGKDYIGSVYAEIKKWLQFRATEGPIGVTFSAGIDSGSVFVLMYHALRELGESPSRLKAFTLFKNSKMALFFVFSMLLGASLQLTNAYGDTFLHDFAKIPEYKDLLTIEYPAIIMSISQMSETLFILAIPFFLRRFGIKKVMMISMVAWVLRFALFGYGNPAEMLWMIILSNIVYGMAFDFFNISGSLFVETQTDSSIRASAQGVFMMMTNGFGAILGSWSSGLIIDNFFKDANGNYEWQGIWLTFAAYSLVITILFGIFFKHEHNREEVVTVEH